MSEPEASESTGMRGQMTHLDTDVLAEFRAGLITGRRGARIAAHLAGCESLHRSGRAAGRGPFAARLGPGAGHAGQRGPAARHGARGRGGPAEIRHSGRRYFRIGPNGPMVTAHANPPRPADRPGGNRGFRLLTLRVLAPAAAVVVLAAGGYGLSRVNLGSSTGSSASTSAGSAARAAAPTAAASAKSGGSVNAPNAGPTKGAVSRPQGITAAGITVVTGHANLTHDDLAQQVRARAGRTLVGAHHAGRDQRRTRLRARADRPSPAGAGRERPFRGQPGHPGRRPHRRARHGLGSGAGLLGHTSSRARYDLAAIGNLRALVSVHWKASQMRG